MGIWSSPGGKLLVVLTSADIPGALSAIDRAEIPMETVERNGEMTLRFLIRRKDLGVLANLCRKRGEDLRVTGKYGLFWAIKGLFYRPVLVLGMLGLLFLTLWVPSRILFVFVQGNDTVPTNLILEQAAVCGIDFGASRREVRSEKMKNALLEQMPQLQWAGVNTQGCVAVITVRERDQQENQPPQAPVSSIVAAQDGVIREITVLSGSPLCTVGQAVKAGQVLISGYTDCGICIRADRAVGEVYGETIRKLTVIFPTQYAIRQEIACETKNYSMIIGKKRINLWNSSGISGSECVRIYSEQYITLPGGFQLPIALAVEQWITYETQEYRYDDPESVLQPFITNYLQAQMIAGQIRSSTQTATCLEGYYRIDGIYGCYEMMGISRPEECILDYENH